MQCLLKLLVLDLIFGVRIFLNKVLHLLVTFSPSLVHLVAPSFWGELGVLMVGGDKAPTLTPTTNGTTGAWASQRMDKPC